MKTKGQKQGKGKPSRMCTSFYTSQQMLLREGLTKPEYWNRRLFLCIYNRSAHSHQSLENTYPMEQDFCPERQHSNHIFELWNILNVQNSNSMYIMRFQNKIHFTFLGDIDYTESLTT